MIIPDAFAAAQVPAAEPLSEFGEAALDVAFAVVSSSQREEIEKALAQIPAIDLYRRDVARARVFTDHRVWYDAIAAYSELITRFPARGELYEQRGKIYAQTQATKALSEKDFKRADEMASPARKPE